MYILKFKTFSSITPVKILELKDFVYIRPFIEIFIFISTETIRPQNI